MERRGDAVPRASLRVEGGAKGARRGRDQGKPVPERSTGRRAQARSGRRGGREKPLSGEAAVAVPQTDTGGQVEDTKASERTLVKELGKMAA